MSRLRTALVIAAVAAATAALTFAGSAGASSGRTALPGSVPTWAKAGARVGSTSGKTRVVFRVYLPWRGGNAAASYAMSASTPGTANSGHFLTPTQFRSRFSPTSSDVNAISKWLAGQGFKVGYSPRSREYVEASGTVAQAAKAFATSFSEYRHAGAKLRAPSKALSVPAGLPAIAGVVGLDESAALVHLNKPAAPPSPVFVNAPPLSASWGQKTITNSPTLDGTALPTSPDYAWAPKGYAGAQLQGAYGMTGAIDSGNDGSGVTVAVIDAYASPTIASDVETYSSSHGLPTTHGLFRQVVAPGIYNRPENPKQDPQGWYGEETLDVEAVHTMAPGASIVYVGAPNNYQDLDAAMVHVVDNHLADIVTNSYGWSSEALPPGYIIPVNNTLIQAAAEGISVLFSSGDNGDETNGVAGATPTPDWTASSPWVTAVGGTSLGVDANNARQFELGWETRRQQLVNGAWAPSTWLYGSGGGTSRLFAQPAYQAGVVPDSIAKTYGGAAMRAVPDVSALGDPNTGMLVGQTQTFPDGTAAYSEYRIGGTSLSSPLMAGMLALSEQLKGAPFGLANPSLYAAAGTAAYYDVTKADLATYPGDVRSDYVNGVDASDGYSYTVRQFDQDGALTIHVGSGYDDVTGMGSPRGTDWLTAVAG
ncbi:MAG TPA: S53 family peptidase [Jatrophihabitans sp.]|jgi:subtilase family serine protease|nr:S53 family peptidase [Jatrophihabitans sp.]